MQHILTDEELKDLQAARNTAITAVRAECLKAMKDVLFSYPQSRLDYTACLPLIKDLDAAFEKLLKPPCS